MNTILKKWGPSAAALALSALLGAAVMEPRLGEAEFAQLAGRFSFDPAVVLAAPEDAKLATVRVVHPSLERISGWISSVGASAALGNLDADGLSNDLCDVDPRTDLVTIRPVPGTGDRYLPFSLSPKQLRYNPSTMAPMGCLLGDLNEDGWLDVIVYYWGRTPIAYLQVESQETLSRNSFREIELYASDERWFTNSATLADFDGDGHIDILFANYFPDGSDILNAKGIGVETLHDTKSKSFNGGRKHFFLFESGTAGAAPTISFRHVAPFSDPVIDRSWTLAVAAADLDGDGLADLYLANDFGPDRLLHNRSQPGQLVFEVAEGRRGFFTPKSAVLGQDSFKGMGAEIGDINGDGLPDILVSNIAAPYSLQESHMAWLNTGDSAAFSRREAPFIQASEQLGLSRSGWGWDIKLADLNNDGVPEIIQATGFLKGQVNRWPELQALATSNDRIMSNPEFWPRFRPGDDLSGHQPNPIFVRDARGRYHDFSTKLGLGEPWVTRGIATGDVDGDGLIDLVYANQWEPSVFIHNRCKDCGAFIGLRLLLARGQHGVAVKDGLPSLRLPAAIGAIATLQTENGPAQTAQVDGGNGHSGRRSPELHFGLGRQATEAEFKVNIAWRAFDGSLQNSAVTLRPGWHTLLLGS